LKLYKVLVDRFQLDSHDPQKLEKFQEYLGFSAEDFNRIGNHLEWMLYCSSERLERVLSFYQVEFDLSNAELRKLVLKFPKIVGYGIETSVVPCMEFLEDLGIRGTHLKKILLRCPSIMMSYEPEASLRAKVDLLDELLSHEPPSCQERRAKRRASRRQGEARPSAPPGASASAWGEDDPAGSVGRAPPPESTLAQVILRDPTVLTLSMESLQERVLFLRSLKMGDSDLATVIRRHPQVLRYSVARMQATVDFFEQIGLDRDGTRHVVVTLPQAFSLSIEDNLEPKCRYLLEEAEWDLSVLARSPSCLSMSLDERIKPRHELLRSIGVPLRPSHLYLSQGKFEERTERLLGDGTAEGDFAAQAGLLE